MIRTRSLLSTIAIVSAMGYSSCTLPKMVKMSKDQEMKVTPNPLEVHADEVKFDVAGTLPVKMLKKKTTYTADVDYKYGDKKTDVGNLEYAAADFPNAKKEQPKLEKNFSFPYQEGMERGELVVQGTAAKGKKSKTTPEMPIAKGIITTSKLVKEADLVAYAESGYNPNPEFEPVDVAFFFPQGSAQLRTSETRSTRGKFLDAFIQEKNVTKTVTITGTHSPEGAERVNSRLSENRAEAIEKYYRGKMRSYNYKQKADSVEFVLKPIIQDWQQLKDTLAATDILNEEQEQQILTVIDGSGDFETKEDELHKLPYYRTLLNQVYPKLRTAQTEMLTLMEKKPDNEIAVIAKQMAEGRADTSALNAKELAYAATLTPDLNEKKGIYEAYVKKTDNWQSHNDLGAIHLELAKKETDQSRKTQLADMAITHLEMARNKQESAEVYNNLAVAYSMKGMRKEAMEAINKATQQTGNEEVTKAINAAKGVMQIRSANYSEAVNTLSQAGDDVNVLYNKGLAQVLAKQYDAALGTLNEAAAKEGADAMTHYVTAIAAARAKNESAMLDALKKAVSGSSDLRTKAMQDLEFDAYANSESFKNALR
ncbi:OmpA family protein [Rhodocytophaga aerolata]|uniref:OmpA family protein n=1 Tax=Rhodocytophaga aerolata TaxID=455078 RepID=A0ABT8R696_9BACT|nr:OmpA family protein [Rhodocytophaga aerolata]MDO1447617.1 OmpA family protein [Rhodocytophaga aerolata]